MKQKAPDYIVVEGPIGVGKTSLSKRLAETFNTELLLEEADDNPFLERFYADPARNALPTQLYFLFQRVRQIQALKQRELFKSVRVADFLMDKDRLFAEINLDDDELNLYNEVYNKLTLDAPVPDLVIYLQAPVEVLIERIRKRGIQYEQQVQLDYLKRVVDAYAAMFHFYNQSPLLIVNAATFDPVNNEKDYESLLKHIYNRSPGRYYLNPLPYDL